MAHNDELANPEARFRTVFAYLGDVTAYARRRGSADAEAIAAETMTIAWRRLADVPRDDPRPWLFATARNLLLAEWRHGQAPRDVHSFWSDRKIASLQPPAEAHALDPELVAALRSLTTADCEALFLVAWEDLSPRLAAQALGISQIAFRVRLHRARRRLQGALATRSATLGVRRPEAENS